MCQSDMIELGYPPYEPPKEEAPKKAKAPKKPKKEEAEKDS